MLPGRLCSGVSADRDPFEIKKDPSLEGGEARVSRFPKERVKKVKFRRNFVKSKKL